MQDAPKRAMEQYSFFGDLSGADDALEVRNCVVHIALQIVDIHPFSSCARHDSNAP
jgi:hypothetical protein